MIFSTTLPPITYINDEQPTTAGEAGLRCLHSIKIMEKVNVCRNTFDDLNGILRRKSAEIRLRSCHIRLHLFSLTPS